MAHIQNINWVERLFGQLNTIFSHLFSIANIISVKVINSFQILRRNSKENSKICADQIELIVIPFPTCCQKITGGRFYSERAPLTKNLFVRLASIHLA